MSKLKYGQSIIGDVYGQLKVVKLVDNINYIKRFLCECTCGNTTVVRMGHLRSGHTKTCGCVNKNAFVHGDAGSPLYKRYYAMLGRCYNPQDSGYSKYGAKGVTVCGDWQESYTAFKEWAESNGYAPSLSIDRIDGRKGYSPDNCRWVPMSVQAWNKGPSASNTSGHVGVNFNKFAGKWTGRVMHNGKRVNTGNSVDLSTAVRLRNQYIKLHNIEQYAEAAKYDTD